MFKTLFRRFAKKATPKAIPGNQSELRSERVKTSDIPIKNVQVGENSVLIVKFRDITTGEITKVPFGDHEKFNECMDNKNMQLIFG